MDILENKTGDLVRIEDHVTMTRLFFNKPCVMLSYGESRFRQSTLDSTNRNKSKCTWPGLEPIIAITRGLLTPEQFLNYMKFLLFVRLLIGFRSIDLFVIINKNIAKNCNMVQVINFYGANIQVISCTFNIPGFL